MVDGSLSSVPGNESVVAAAAAFALTTKQTHSETELPIGAQILKQMIACACGQMPPGFGHGHLRRAVRGVGELWRFFVRGVAHGRPGWGQKRVPAAKHDDRTKTVLRV